MPDAESPRPNAGKLPFPLTEVYGGQPLLLPPEVFDDFSAQAQVLDLRLGRPSTLGHADAEGRPLVTRLWYPKGPFSSDRLRPYSERFVRAAASLQALGLEAPRVRAYGRVTDGRLRFVTYEPVRGRALRELGHAFDSMDLARFVLQLHDLGVYCRGLNLGNLVQLADGRFSLVDVSDTRFRGGPLSRRQRERNLGILCSHPEDLALMVDGRWSELVMAYCRAAGVSLARAAGMRDRVRLQVQRRNARRRAASDPLMAHASNGEALLPRQ